MAMRPVIYDVKFSKHTAKTGEKVNVSVLADDIEVFTTEKIYMRADGEIIAGQQIGVI